MATFGIGANPYPARVPAGASPIGSSIGVNGSGQMISSVASPPQCNVIYVDDMKAVLDYPTSANEQLYFPEKNSNVIWVRETDGNAQIRNPLKKLVYSAEDVPFGPEANFVTKEEYQKLFDLVSSMNGQIENLIAQLK